MIPGRIRSNISVFARTQLGLSPGDLVSVQVIKRLIGNKWAIGIRGQVFPAISDIELAPGQRIQTLVRRSGQTLNLQIKTIHEEADESAVSSKGVPEPLLQRLNPNRAPFEAPLLSRLVRLFDRLVADRKRRETRIARSIAFLLDRGLEPSSKGLEDLIKSIAFVSDSGAEGRREKGRQGTRERSERLVELLRKRASEKEENEGGFHPLQVINHLKSRRDSWLVVPFSFFDEYHGIVKVLLEDDHRRVKRIVLDVPLGGEILSFILTPHEGKIRLSLCCEEPDTVETLRKKIRAITPKLQNHGVEYDDSIYDGRDFDGFYLQWEGPSRKSLDIVT
jgi:hypothetical protein